MIIFEQYDKYGDLLFLNYKVWYVIEFVFNIINYRQKICDLVKKYLNWNQYTMFNVFSSRSSGWKNLR